MAFEYLIKLPVGDSVREKLRALGARTPAALLSLLEYAPDRFKQVLGAETFSSVFAVLEKLVPQAERERMAALPDFRPKLGAISRPKPSIQSLQATTRRDELAAQIRTLRSGEQSPEVQEKIEELEALLRDELKKTVASVHRASAG